MKNPQDKLNTYLLYHIFLFFKEKSTKKSFDFFVLFRLFSEYFVFLALSDLPAYLPSAHAATAPTANIKAPVKILKTPTAVRFIPESTAIGDASTSPKIAK